MKDHTLLDQLTQQVLNKEITLEVACFRYLTRERKVNNSFSGGRSPFIHHDECTNPAMLVTTFEVIQP